MSAVALLREDLRGFPGYASARREAVSGRIWLNANESPWPAQGPALHRYPDPQPARLLQALAALYEVEPACVLVTRGSDEAIDLLVRACCPAGRSAVLTATPSFGMYAVCTRIQGARLIEVPLRARAGFSFDSDRLIDAIGDDVRLVLLCSPNNPTGSALSLRQLARVAGACSGRALLVVDEAYAEFSSLPSALHLASRFENLVVLRTLSKAHALAGARLGALLAAPALVGALRNLLAPYPIPTPCARAALSGLRPAALARSRMRIQVLLQERERLATALGGMAAVRRVYPSQANFLLVEFHDAARTYRHCLGRGIVLRDVSAQPGLRDCLRISVGSPEENAVLLACLLEDA